MWARGSDCGGDCGAQVDTEIQVHSSLQHDNIIKFLAAFEDHRNTYLVIEYADEGDVRNHLHGLNERSVRDFLVVPVLNALNALHNKVRSSDSAPEQGQVQEVLCALAGPRTQTVRTAATDASACARMHAPDAATCRASPTGT